MNGRVEAHTDTDADTLARGIAPLGPAPTDEADLESLIAWHRGTLDADAAAAVEARLAIDPDARAFVADLAEPPSAFLTRWSEARLRPIMPRIARFITVLAAAALAIFALWPDEPPPGYALAVIRGVEQDVRGEPTAPNATHRIDDEVTLTLTLAPTDTIPDGEQIHAIAWTTDATGRLERTTVQGTVSADGTWYIEAPTRALFGERYGPRTLHVALAYSPDDLEDLTGRAPPTTEADGDVRWHHLRFDYRRSDAR